MISCGRELVESKGNQPEMADDVTQLLLDLSSGDREALDKLVPMVYTELRQTACW